MVEARTVDELLAETEYDELPAGWTGGEATDVGGSGHKRFFRNGEYRVEYSAGAVHSVTLERVDENGDLEEVVARRHGAETDVEKFVHAVALMREANAGRYE